MVISVLLVQRSQVSHVLHDLVVGVNAVDLLVVVGEHLVGLEADVVWHRLVNQLVYRVDIDFFDHLCLLSLVISQVPGNL